VTSAEASNKPTEFFAVLRSIFMQTPENYFVLGHERSFHAHSSLFVRKSYINSQPSSSEFKNDCSYTCVSPYVITTCTGNLYL